MNTRKTVYNKLFKEEVKLATHEVELGSIDIFIEAYKKEAAKLAGIKAKIIASNDELGFVLGALESLPSVGDSLIAKMKDLGVEQELQNVQAVNNSIKGLIKSLNPIYKNIINSSKSI
jgi:hypothetical protein